jgi:uncharacterized protein (UPF0332 family)
MRMSLGEFLKKGLIEKISADKGQVARLLEISKRDAGVAEHLLPAHCDSSFIHSYNSILQSARALMFFKGYRPIENEHKTTIDFVAVIFPSLDYFADLDRMRRKRHVATYDEANTITEYEARHAVKVAKEFLEFVTLKV